VVVQGHKFKNNIEIIMVIFAQSKDGGTRKTAIVKSNATMEQLLGAAFPLPSESRLYKKGPATITREP
jgi:hypothetical protein